VAEPDELDAGRARFPVGEVVTGRVAFIPKPGVIGLFVDLGREPEGFVDVLHLPVEPGQWPPVGTVTTFEVLQHRPGQVRLFPLSEQFRSPERLPAVSTPEQWLVIKERFPVGTEVTATVTDVFPANREYAVRFEDCWSVLEWTGDPPRVGTASRYAVTRHLDRTRRIMIAPVLRRT
jgi:ribosomal protein S1